METYQCSKVGKTCIYCKGTQHNGPKTCNYILSEKKRRGCQPEACDKYVRKERRGRRRPKCMGS